MTPWVGATVLSRRHDARVRRIAADQRDVRAVQRGSAHSGGGDPRSALRI